MRAQADLPFAIRHLRDWKRRSSTDSELVLHAPVCLAILDSEHLGRGTIRFRSQSVLCFSTVGTSTMESSMDSTTTIAYAAIYLLWGGAYLAIRCLVQEFPPLWAAGTRYALATICLVVLLAFRGLPLPTLRQFINAAWTGVVLLAMAYGSLFWAAKDLPAWLVAVLMSTTFLWTYIGETLVFRVYPFRIRILPPLLSGLIAVPFLVSRGSSRGGGSIAAVLAVLFCAICWSIGSLAAKRIRMPAYPVQTATIQLGTSAFVLLIVSRLLGEWNAQLVVAGLFALKPLVAMGFLVLGGFAVAIIPFHWLLARQPASLVATAAYVNPVVAMLVGIVIACERASPTQFLGGVGVLAGISIIWSFEMPSLAASRLPLHPQ
jgi:drug/metabolite transporter (DMT)-like permease